MYGTIVKLEGTAVVNSIGAAHHLDIVSLTLFVDGTALAEGRAMRVGGTRRSLRLNIPSDWLDGLPHHLAVRAPIPGTFSES